MYYSALSKGVRHFKETEEGREVMCESFEKLAREMAEESAEIATENKGIESFFNALKMGISKEDAQKIANITDEQVEKAFSLNK